MSEFDVCKYIIDTVPSFLDAQNWTCINSLTVEDVYGPIFPPQSNLSLTLTED